MASLLYHRRAWLPSRGVRLPWTLFREKRASDRIADVPVVQDYVQSLLCHDDIRNSEPLLSFLEVSPSRAMSRYGPSLKEGYVHMRVNGAFQLPLYSCFNRTIEALYRHLYRTWMRIAFIAAVVTFIFPICLVLVTALPAFVTGKNIAIDDAGSSVDEKISVARVFFGLFMVFVMLYSALFVYKFFDHRLGVIRRWVVLKPNCFAAFRRRQDKEPSEVFLFDKSFSARKGSYRQGVSWMPSGFVVGSRAGFIEVDTGHYYTRLTMSIALAFVCWAILVLSARLLNYNDVHFPNGAAVTSLPNIPNTLTKPRLGL
ncbi:hypothetical protein PINS_up020997 [Pythium insidiosum]|nr:hypothetical protein PINS_up020997 [Pythium insidiosum]